VVEEGIGEIQRREETLHHLGKMLSGESVQENALTLSVILPSPDRGVERGRRLFIPTRGQEEDTGSRDAREEVGHQCEGALIRAVEIVCEEAEGTSAGKVRPQLRYTPEEIPAPAFDLFRGPVLGCLSEGRSF